MPRGPWAPLLVVVLVGSVGLAIASSEFLTTFNIYVVLANAALMSVIGFSQLAALSVGEFSLAVGGIGSLTGVVIGHLLVERGFALGPALAVGIAVGIAAGLLNGVLVAKSGVNGFVITLATGGAFTGLALGITESIPYTDMPKLLNTFGTGRYGFLPYLGGATVVVAVLLFALYRWRRTGRMMLAVGGNREAAELSGISTARAIICAHTLSGLLAAVAGVMAMAQLHEANPSAGIEWLILSFTLPIIGGTSLNGGSVSIAGVLVAAVIIATIQDGLVLVNVNPYWVTLVIGVLVFVAVALGREETWRLWRGAFARLRVWRPVDA